MSSAGKQKRRRIEMVAPKIRSISTESSRNRTQSPKLIPGEEMNIYLKILKTVALKVKKNENIKNLKSLLHEKEGIPEGNQGIFFAGDQLKDRCNLNDYSISENSTLHVIQGNSCGMKLFVKLSSWGRTMVIEPLAHYTVQSIKLLIEEKENVRADRFSLVHDGKLLEEHTTLASLKLDNESTLVLVQYSNHIVTVVVRLPSGNAVAPKVNLLSTVGDLKVISGSMVGTSIEDEAMMYEEEPLYNCKTLAYYGINVGSIIDVVSSFEIYIRDSAGEEVTLFVNKCTTINEVLDQLPERIGIARPKIRLLHDGIRLCDDQYLVSYDIEEHDIIDAFAFSSQP